MRLLYLLGFLLCWGACKNDDASDLRDNLIGEWDYIVAITQVANNGMSFTTYHEGFIELNADGTGRESTIYNTTYAFTWEYENDPPQFTKVTSVFGNPIGNSISYDILVNQKDHQEWFVEFVNSNEKILNTWILSR